MPIKKKSSRAPRAHQDVGENPPQFDTHAPEHHNSRRSPRRRPDINADHIVVDEEFGRSDSEADFVLPSSPRPPRLVSVKSKRSSRPQSERKQPRIQLRDMEDQYDDRTDSFLQSDHEQFEERNDEFSQREPHQESHREPHRRNSEQRNDRRNDNRNEHRNDNRNEHRNAPRGAKSHERGDGSFERPQRHHKRRDESNDEPEQTIGKKEIFISAALNEIRIAITEEERLAELFWELPEKERQVGNLYLGKIQRIIQGMNAAFVDIGFKQDAFLHFSDVDEKDEFTDDDDDDDDIVRPATPDDDEPLSKAAATALRRTITAPRNISKLPTFKTKSSGDVKINLIPGQDIIVQVVREAYSSKGFRVSSKISLPGRYMVLLPFSGSVGISKKIKNIKERKRLRTIARSILPPEVGCIVRTEAEDRDDAVLRKDFEELLRLWRELELKVKKATKPGLVHRDMSMTNSLMRDLLTENVKRVVVDSKKLYLEIDKYVEWAAPHMRKHIEFYDPIVNARQSMFSAVGVEQEITLAVSRKVPLPSGGYLIIEQTEAMVVVDVNSGRFTGEREQEQNSLRINMEAAREMARQLRIRDIGGMVVIDFIDMQDDANRKKLVNEMHRFMRPDRAKFVIYPLTQLGLMQITRQRIRQSISQVLSDSCPACVGTGIVKSPLVVISDIERWFQKFIASPGREFRVELHVHPSIAKDLTEGTFSKLARLMVKYFIKITLRQDEFLRSDDYRVMSVRKQRDITHDIFSAV